MSKMNGRQKRPTSDNTEQPSTSSESTAEVTTPTYKRGRISYSQKILEDILQKLKPSEQHGPIYPKTKDSIVLYEPNPDNLYNEITKQDGIVPVVINPHFVKSLKTEQIDGLKFMWNSFCKNQGCILAHEMGLGKTFTSIVLIWTLLEQNERSHNKSTPSIQKVIIVTPKGLGQIWKDEFDKWSPSDTKLDLEIIDSSTKTNDGIHKIQGFETNTKQVLIFSYNNWKKYQLELTYFKSPIQLVICDEAHRLKNRKTQMSIALRSKLRNRETGVFSNTNLVQICIGLTGTPYQNSEEELCNLVEFFRPNTLSLNYKENFIKPITISKNSKNTKKNDKEKIQLENIAKKKRAKLHKLIAPVICHMSNHVTVDKHEVIVCVDFNHTDTENDDFAGLQRELYTSSTNNIELLPNLYVQIDLLKKICIHPIYGFDESIAKKSELNDIYEEYIYKIEELNQLKEKNAVYSAKINLVINMLADLKSIHPDEKAIVVSYSVHLLKLIMTYLKKCDLSCLLYDGELSEKERKKIIEKFNSNGNGVFILLLSCKSGGTGLDLSVANNLFLLDPDWNPANDKQVLSRIYRPGQTKDCYIYRFLTTNTIEEVIFMNQLSKTEMDLYYKGQDPNVIHQCGYDSIDLIKYHKSEHSFIKDKLNEIEAGKFQQNILDEFENDHVGAGGTDERESVEICQFAIELNESRKYSKKDDIPNNILNILKRNWDHGVTYAFHKFKGDDFTTSILTLEEEFLNISDSEISN